MEESIILPEDRFIPLQKCRPSLRPSKRQRTQTDSCGLSKQKTLDSDSEYVSHDRNLTFAIPELELQEVDLETLDSKYIIPKSLNPVEVKRKIKDIMDPNLKSLLAGDGYSFKIPKRKKIDMAFIDDLSFCLLKRDQDRYVDRKFTDARSTGTAAMTTWVLSKVYELLSSGQSVTIRDIFYECPNLFRVQATSDRIIVDVSLLLGCTRLSMNLKTEEDSSVCGMFYMELVDEQNPICCSKGVSIPVNPSKISGFRLMEGSDIDFILVIEKGTIFNYLRDREFHIKHKCILITSKGMPDVSTRSFLKHLHKKHTNLRIYGICDPDPHGYQILKVYNQGSVNLAHENINLAVPNLIWLGISMKDIFDAGIVLNKYNSSELSNDELNILDNMLNDCALRLPDFWKLSFMQMRTMGRKTHFEVFHSHGFDYVADVLLPSLLEKAKGKPHRVDLPQLPKKVTQPKKATQPAKEETIDDSSDKSSSDDEPSKIPAAPSNKPTAATASSSNSDDISSDEEPAKKPATLAKKPAAVVSNASEKVVSDSSNSDSSSDEESDEDEKPAAQPKKPLVASAQKKTQESDSSASDSDDESDEDLPAKAPVAAKKKEELSESSDSESDESEDEDNNAKTVQPAKAAAPKKKEESSDSSESDSESNSGSDEEPKKPLAAKRPLATDKKNEQSSDESDDSSDESSDESDKEPPRKKSKKPAAQPKKPLVASAQKKTQESDSSASDSDDESDEDLPAKAPVAAKKKEESSESSDSESDESEDEDNNAKTVQPAKAAAPKKKEESSDSSESDSESNSGSDEEPKKPLAAKRPLATDKKNEQSSDESDDSSDESSDESDKEPPRKKSKNSAPAAAKSASKVSKKESSSDESSDDESEESSDDDKEVATKVKPKVEVDSEDESIKQAKTPKTTPAQTEAKTGSKTIFVGNLPYSIQKKDVEEFFKEAGEVVDVRLSTKHGEFKGYGHVEFATPEAAQKALEFAYYDLRGRPVRVDLAHERGAYAPDRRGSFSGRGGRSDRGRGGGRGRDGGRGRGFGGRGGRRGRPLRRGRPFKQSAGTASTGKKTTFGDDE